MFKVWVLGYGETKWATNGLKFETADEARKWGNGLFGRWMGAKEIAVLAFDESFDFYITTETVEANRIGEIIK